MEDPNLLFDLIKQHKFNQLIDILDKDSGDFIDLNIRDDQNNYLLSYAVLFNKLDIVKLLLDKGARIDITDNDDKSVLYIPIKYGYNDIIKIILETNAQNIGISVHDIKDRNNNIPIHYAIKYKNIDALKMLLEFGSNPNVTDNGGNNSLHLAVYSRSFDICNYIMNYNIDINSKTNIGESALHIAANLQEPKIFKLIIDNSNVNVNSQDYDHEFTALHYSVNLNNIDQVDLLLKNNANPNLQDVYGNTILHYIIMEENMQLLNVVTEFKYTDYTLNYNLWNIDGKLPLHIVLNIHPQNIDTYLDIMLKETNVNIPDNYGFTCLLYLCKFDLWKKYKDVLIKKKLDITVINNDNERPVDFIKDKDIDEFIDMMTKSYLYRLRNEKTTWMEQWQNICQKELLAEHLSDSELKTINNLNINLEKNIEKNKDICQKIVDKRIRDIIKNSNQNQCYYKSYPLKQGHICINISENSNLQLCTFTGSTLDILIGLIYLLKKHPDSCSTVNTDFAENKKLCLFYKNMGISVNSRCEFMNFEIVWIYNKLYLTDNFFDNFKKCYSDNEKRYIIIPLGIEMKEGSHANYIIYDKNLNEVERFEPHGSSPPIGFNYNPKLLDQILENRFKDINPDIRYISPEKYLPKIGFQILDIIEKNNKKIGDPGGFCALWVIWYTDMKLTYKSLNREKLVKNMLSQMKSSGVSFKNLIRNYSKNIIELRDKYFSQINVDINDWINDKVSDDQIKILVKNISDDINKIS
ncbi:ankyrin repeat protein [Catovirus CTV1]|uniref:Ankyrin repeat protein n=1 Tax=Catovirus CTV1 TaxID=1977631 RepID=A0A1V0SBZ2_9VIRU|nr:ankyrin repeat protein [Catovirus CTV1]